MSTRNDSRQQVSTTAPVGASVGDTWFDPSTNRQYQLLPSNGTSVQWAEVPTSANSYGAVTASPGAWTALQSFLGTSSSLGLALNNLAERVNFVGTGATGTIDYNVTSQSVLYYIGNAASNWIVNFRGSEGASLNSIMAIGQSVTAVLLANQGANAFINNGVRVDGISYTPAWQGGTAPTSGSANGTDLYSYTLVKTNEFSFIVFASRTAHSKPTFVTNVPGVATPSLYEFSSATFSPGGTTGRDGPSLANARTGLTGTGTDAWKGNTAFFTVVDGIQYWTVPRSANYVIEAWGAQGGNAGGQQGGRGAKIQGTFALTEGEIIRILVGQQGQSGPHTQDGNPMGAGGGGTYVIRTPYNNTGSILVIAGGGGGAAQNSYSNAAGINATSANNGTNGGGGGSDNQGGTGGNGGAGGTGNGSGPGGAGFTGNGLVDPLSGNSAGDNSKSFVNGGRGGRKSLSWGGSEIFGGFGGGGGGGGLACGGGGGYSGGGGGTWTSPQQGGGGGSFNSATIGAVNENGGSGQATLSGAGQVRITVEDPGNVPTSPPLYTFTNATFTPGGTTGRDGPSLATARTGLTGTGVDGWKNDTSFFNTTSGIQFWTVPATGTYSIEAWGAQGGGGGYNGGFGARMKGDFTLTQGEIIRILVGQTGGNSYGGGGGGTFVIRTPYNTTQSILVIAGGGNTTSPWSSTTSHAPTGQNGLNSSSGGAGGTDGGGGQGGNNMPGGAGFSGNGGSSSCGSSQVPLSFINGGQGGITCNSIGGFGGGSGSDGCCQGASGPGGGYSGGGAGNGSGVWGGAGGSFNSGSNQSNDAGSTGSATLAYGTTGGGRVIITRLT